MTLAGKLDCAMGGQVAHVVHITPGRGGAGDSLPSEFAGPCVYGKEAVKAVRLCIIGRLPRQPFVQQNRGGIHCYEKASSGAATDRLVASRW